MNWWQTVLLFVIGGSALAMMAYALLLLKYHPERLTELLTVPNEHAMTWTKRFHGLIAIVILVLALIAIYQGTILCLSWIPSDWGYVSEGEWTSIRSMTATIFSIWFTILLFSGINHGLEARPTLKRLEMISYLRRDIDSANSVERLVALKQQYGHLVHAPMDYPEKLTVAQSERLERAGLSSYELISVFVSITEVAVDRIFQLEIMGVNVGQQR